MLVAAVGAYAWDSSKSDEIADGVTIGGVDVSGMNADEATKVVESELVDPLRKKVTVTYDGVKYQLSPEKLEVDSDVDGMVDKALEESQEGGLPTRVWRYATGGEVDVAISPQVTYSNKAIDEFIAKVAADVNTEPVNATIEPTRGLARRRRGPRRGRGQRVRASHPDRVGGPADRAAQGHGAGRHGRARGQQGGPRRPVSDLPDRQPLDLRAHPLEGPRTGEDLHGRDRRRGLRHPGGRLQHPEQGGRSRLERARLRLGRRWPARLSPAAPRTTR